MDTCGSGEGIVGITMMVMMVEDDDDFGMVKLGNCGGVWS